MREEDIPERKSLAERLASLFRVDCIRGSRLLETAQYAFIYSLLCLPVGVALDRTFTGLYPRVEEGQLYSRRQLWTAVFMVVLQVVVNAVVIFYVRKVASIFPFFFNFCPKRYISHYHVEELFGEVAIAMIFVGVQTNLISVLEKIRKSA
jgi:hypothetical protein